MDCLFELGLPIDGSSESEDDAVTIPDEERCTPVKRGRLSLADCFDAELSVPRESGSSGSVNWHTQSKNISMSELLQSKTGDEATERGDATGSCPVAGHIDLDEIATWHPNRLWALVWEQTVKTLLPLRIRRIKDKQRDWRRLLNLMQRDPLAVLPEHGSGLERSRGQDMFRRMLCKHSGCSWRAVRSVGKNMWAKANMMDRFRWSLFQYASTDPDVAKYCSSMKGPRVPVPRALADSFEATETKAGPRVYERCAGLMLTYNTDVGLLSPDIMIMVQEGRSPEEYIGYISKSELHMQAFESFWSFLLNLAEKLKFPTVGACMELSAHAAKPGRVHFHAYIGGGIRGGPGAMCSIPRADVAEPDLVHHDCRPQVRPTLPRKNHPKTVFEAIVNGLYYVIADKTSSIARRSTCWPVKDRFGSVMAR